MSNVIVLFEVTIKDGKMDDYLKMAASLKEELSKAEGFVSGERFTSISTEGKILSQSMWENEACIEKWRNNALHRLCQKHGRAYDFADYKITIVTPIRSYGMNDREGAPVDSNACFGL